MQDVFCVHTVNDKSYAREKLCGFHGFSMDHESFPYESNALSNGSTFNTDEAKPQKFSLH